MKKELKEKLKEQFDIIVQSSKNSTSDDIVEFGVWAYNLAKSEYAERIKELEDFLSSLRQHPRIDPILQGIIADKLTPPNGL